jgi:ureidoglycolate lyase
MMLPPLSLVTTPLTAEAFAPFGLVLEAPADPGRAAADAGLDHKPGLAPMLMVSRLAPSATPVVATRIERHAHSSQVFVPLDVSRWLVVGVPSLPDGAPDLARAQAFIARAGQVVLYRRLAWHHPGTVFDRPASFAVAMWGDGSDADTDWFTLPTQITIAIPEEIRA